MRVPQEDRCPTSHSSATKTAGISLRLHMQPRAHKTEFHDLRRFREAAGRVVQDGADQDIGVQDNHLNERQPSHDDASA